jgi:hypothetical protein
MCGSESVTAAFIFEVICDAESVMRILDAALGADLDIFAEGSLRLRILFEGTKALADGLCEALTDQGFGDREDFPVCAVEGVGDILC